MGESHRGASQAINAYQALSQEQGHELALYALELFDASRGKDEDRDIVLEMLGDLAIFVPGSLCDFHPRLIEREMFWPGQVYLGADAKTRDQLMTLVEQVKQSQMLGSILECLAWVGDEVVQSKFSGWRGKLSLPFNGAIDEYTREAGWELTSEGKRRDLYYQQWRQLLSVRSPAAADTQTPADAGAVHDKPCEWCGLKMAYVSARPLVPGENEGWSDR